MIVFQARLDSDTHRCQQQYRAILFQAQLDGHTHRAQGVPVPTPTPAPKPMSMNERLDEMVRMAIAGREASGTDTVHMEVEEDSVDKMVGDGYGFS